MRTEMSANLQGRKQQWRFWAAKGGLALIDQALLSGSNFAFTVLLARSLSVQDYGSYAVAFSVFLLLGTVYQGVLLVPSLIIGPTLYAGCRAEYLGAMLKLHAIASLVLGGSLLIAAAVAAMCSPGSGLAGSFAGLALALPCVLLFWLARSACYLDLSPGPAAAGALIYCVLLLGGVGLLAFFGRVSPFNGFLVMMLAGLTLGVFLLARLRPRFGGISAREVWRESWVYGRWELAIAVALWLPTSLCYPLAASILGSGAAGGLRALHNLALPMGHALTAVMRLAQPYFAASSGGNRSAFDLSPIRRLALLMMGGAGVYLVLISLLRRPIMQALYGGKFLDFINLAPWILLCTVFASGAEALGTGLRAMRSPALVFRAYSIGAAAYLVAGPVLTRAFGMEGVAASLVLSSAVVLAASSVLLSRHVRKSSNSILEEREAVIA